MNIPAVDYKGVFEAGSALYLILLPDAPKFTIVGASDVYLQATMRKREELVGKGVFEAFPPNPTDVQGKMEKTFRAAFARVMQTKKVDVMPVQQYDIPKPDGGFEIRYWSVTHNPILDAKGTLIQMAQRVDDVTELLRLKQHGDYLETEVMLRAREIKEANNRLAETNKELEAFGFSVSHDLHSPLQSMISYGEMLLDEHQASLNAEGKAYLHRIIDASQRMGMLINGMLDLARISHQEVHRENVDLSRLVQSLREQLMSRDRARKIEFVIEPGMKAVGDSMLLDLMLQNLLSNAWKFTAKKAVAKIEVGRMKKNSEEVFYVKDNGAGFDMKQAGKLFESFKRLHPDSDFTGTGIGLATVQKIINRHEGKIWVDADVDKGATFFFTLPNFPSTTQA